MAWKITFRFQGGNVLCKLVAYGQVATMYVAAYVLVATAVDRYLAICHPLRTQVWNGRRMNTIVVGIWVASLAAATPQFYVFSYRPVSTSYQNLNHSQHTLSKPSREVIIVNG